MTDHPEDLLAPFVLDALTAEERAEVLWHLATCSQCRDTVASFRDVTAVLPLGVPESPESPPIDLRQRIVMAAAHTPQLAAPTDRRAQQHLLAPRRRTPARWLSQLVAAALAVLSAGLIVWNVGLQRQLHAFQIATPRAAALLATASAPGASGSVAFVAGGPITVNVANLPKLPAGKVYEAWVIDAGGPKAAGTFVTTPEGYGALVLTQTARVGDTIAVTAEPTPGDLAPTGEVLLKGAATS